MMCSVQGLRTEGVRQEPLTRSFGRGERLRRKWLRGNEMSIIIWEVGEGGMEMQGMRSRGGRDIRGR